MTDEEAVILYKKVGERMKRIIGAKMNSNEPLERRMAEAIVFLKNKKRQQNK